MLNIDEFTVIVGVFEYTVTFTVFVEEQLKELVPITVYVVVIVGATDIVVPVNANGFQLYVLAPLAVSVAVCPTQMDVGLATAVTVGLGLTVTVTVFVLVQPTEFVPVTV
jgi:hypothetical protein